MSGKIYRLKGRSFKSLSELYAHFKDVAKVCRNTFLTRCKKGISIPAALYKSRRSYKVLIYNGVKYKSAASCYEAEKKRIRRFHHRSPAIQYLRFLEIVNSKGVSAAIKRMHQWHLNRRSRCLNKKSRELGGADNLVCQRITKLGWSLERAMTTPRCSKGAPISVHYKGNMYASIAECYRAVSPEVSITKFASYLREHNFRIT